MDQKENADPGDRALSGWHDGILFFPSGDSQKKQNAGFLYPNNRFEKNNAEQFDQPDRHSGKRGGIERYDEPVAGGEVDSSSGRRLGGSWGYHLCPGYG